MQFPTLQLKSPKSTSFSFLWLASEISFSIALYSFFRTWLGVLDSWGAYIALVVGVVVAVVDLDDFDLVYTVLLLCWLISFTARQCLCSDSLFLFYFVSFWLFLCLMFSICFRVLMF